MKIAEVLNSFTPAQRKEFDADVEQLILRAGIEFDFDSSKEAEINSNMRLQGNEVHLNFTMFFRVDENGKVNGKITQLKRLTVDEYLDSINAAKNLPDGSKNLKV
jgi:hypothetical protein